jgi:hypothetical protein
MSETAPTPSVDRAPRGESQAGHPMKSLLTSTATLEAATGVALAVAPSPVIEALLGSRPDSAAALVLGRVFGAALCSLGASCWIARGDAGSRSAAGLVAAMLLYNIATVSLLLHARFGLGISGVALWPAILLHSGLAVWCVGCLRIATRAPGPQTNP